MVLNTCLLNKKIKGLEENVGNVGQTIPFKKLSWVPKKGKDSPGVFTVD